MQLTCNTRELAQKVALVERATTYKRDMAVLGMLRLTAGDGRLSLEATDLDVYVKTNLPAQVSEAGESFVDAKTFGQIIKKLPGEDVGISQDDSVTQIASGQSRFKLVGLGDLDFPEFAKIKGQAMTVKGSEFTGAIRRTVFAALDDDPQPAFTGVYFNPDNGLNLVATDGNRIALQHLDGEYGERSAIIPARSLRFMLGVECPDVKLTLGDRQAKFELGDTVVISRLVEGRYPDYKRVIPSPETFIEIDRKQLMGALDRLSIAADAALFEVSDGILTLANWRSEKAQFRETIELAPGVCDCKTAYSLKYLLEPLKVFQSEKVIWRPQDELGATVIQDGDDNSYTYVVMPMRVS